MFASPDYGNVALFFVLLNGDQNELAASRPTLILGSGYGPRLATFEIIGGAAD
ncbi:MAG TPA: hypothetical protein VHW69_01080 [Rhizomicrobium sp.]|jgi:hypothetical protein|nr:hypothetical protein [Rhizomicrobium sp.]